ncbi:MAG: Gfo/Idh/MocA family oxidoreductase [Gemmataceae bacterium]|nr:Gfo/Idh/MocA family oxidoreductase [Gemmataceae bacterium]
MSRITRRAFVATAAAAPLVVSRPGFGQDKKDAPNSRLGVGFIGMGIQSRGHVNFCLNAKDVQVLAVCDVDTTRRAAAKATVDKKYADATKSGEYKGCTAYTDYRELLAQPGIDAVVICTPDHWHAIPCLEALKAKKDVYCEKPLTLTIGEAKAVLDATRKYDRVFQTGSQQRSEETFRKACELVRNGRIGTLRAVYVNIGGPSKPCDLPEEKEEPGLDWDRWLGPAPRRPYNSVLSPRGIHNHFPNWRNYREYSGGMMTDWGAHHFDIAQWGLGMDESGPVEVVPPTDPKAERGVKFVYANGVPVIHAEEYEPGKKVDGVAFVGSNGKIFVNRGKLSSDPGEVIKEPASETGVRLPKSPGHQRDWLGCVKSRKRPICDVEIGARSVTVCHLGNIAYWTRKTVKWDPKEWKFVGADAEVAKWYDRERRDPYQLPKV